MPNRAAAVGDIEAAERFEGKISTWLRDCLIPRLAGVFGEKCSTEEAECTVTRPRGSFFLSDLFFASIRFPGSVERRVLVKLPSQDPAMRKVQNYDELFANETLFYQRVADSESEDFPKCYLAGKDPVVDRVIVLENVCSRGFFICAKKVNLHLDYVLAWMRSIGRFHGHTYAMKEKTPENFYQIVKGIKMGRFDSDLVPERFIESVNTRLARVSTALRARGYDPDFTKRIEDLLEDAYTNVMLRCIKPVEPLATIVHGDCTINNVLYRKVDSEECGLEAMLIDYALMMYSSPAIDVSTFIYMSCSREDIKERSEDLFRAYYDSLAQSLKDHKVWTASKYSRESLWRDYKQRTMFGYVVGAYFLPMMTEYEANNNLLQLDEETIKQANSSGGGEALTNALVDMLIDLREAGLLDYCLNDDKLDVC